MPDEIGTEATRPDTPDTGDSPGGDAAEDKPAAAAAKPAAEGANEETPQDGQDADNEVAQDGRTEAAENDKGADEAGEETSSQDDLKVVVSIKGGRAIIGVQRPSADPHIETFDDLDETGLTQEVPAVIDRARARWEDNPRHPAYARPVPVRSRSRRGQGAAQATTADGEEAQQATFGLF